MEIYCTGCGKLMLACASCQEKVCVFVDKAKPHVPGIYCCRSCRVAFAQGVGVQEFDSNQDQSVQWLTCG